MKLYCSIACLDNIVFVLQSSRIFIDVALRIPISHRIQIMLVKLGLIQINRSFGVLQIYADNVICRNRFQAERLGHDIESSILVIQKWYNIR
ncbi:hypothetical protein D3C76_1461920 [compost metagenome]